MRLVADLTLVDGRFQPGLAVSIEDGRIADIGPFPPAWGDAAFATDLVRLPGKALLPGTVNAHCHTFQSLLRGLGDDLDFMAWRDRVLYPYSTRLDREGIYLGAAFAFAEMLLHGATTCVDFFYLQDEGNDNAEAVIQAARAGPGDVRLGRRAGALSRAAGRGCAAHGGPDRQVREGSPGPRAAGAAQ